MGSGRLEYIPDTLQFSDALTDSEYDNIVSAAAESMLPQLWMTPDMENNPLAPIYDHSYTVDQQISIGQRLIATMDSAVNSACRPEQIPFHLYVDDVNPKVLRLYINPVVLISTLQFQNQFYSLLFELGQDHELNIYLGTGAGHWPLDGSSIGPILNAMAQCDANIICHATGKCSASETLLWMYAKHRVISTYGVLRFEGCLDIIDKLRYYHNYYRALLSRAVEIELFGEDVLEMLLTTNEEFDMLQGKEILK